MKQGDLPLATYYSYLKQMWEEINHYITFRPKCKEDIIVYARHVEEFKNYELLVGLNPEYDQLRVNILGKNLLPPLNEVHAYLHREEKRRSTMS